MFCVFRIEENTCILFDVLTIPCLLCYPWLEILYSVFNVLTGFSFAALKLAPDTTTEVTIIAINTPKMKGQALTA